jgi:hypothetical protein
MAKGFGKFGGSGKMHGRVGTGAQKPGVSSQQGSSPLAGGPGTPKAGSRSAGFYSPAATNKDYAGTQTPGVSSQTKAGGNARFAAGGKGSMFGNRGSLASRAGRSTTG